MLHENSQGTLPGEPHTSRCDRLLFAWSLVCKSSIDSLSVVGTCVEERRRFGVAIYLLHVDAKLTTEEIAKKINAPLSTVRLLLIETRRALASKKAARISQEATFAKIRALALRQRSDSNVLPRAVVQKPRQRAKRGSRTPITPIDADVAVSVVRRVAPLFRSSCSEVLAMRSAGLREVRWSRMTAIAILHRIVMPDAQLSAIAQFFHVVPGTVDYALRTVGNFATTLTPEQYGHPVAQACLLYRKTPDVLNPTRKS
jgi:hypothetical protein